MKKFAYIGKGNILHVVESEKDAYKYKATGKVVETTAEAAHGFPVFDGEEVIAYGPTEMKVDATKGCITPVPEIAALWTECAGM